MLIQDETIILPNILRALCYVLEYLICFFCYPIMEREILHIIKQGYGLIDFGCLAQCPGRTGG